MSVPRNLCWMIQSLLHFQTMSHQRSKQFCATVPIPLFIVTSGRRILVILEFPNMAMFFFGVEILSSMYEGAWGGGTVADRWLGVSRIGEGSRLAWGIVRWYLDVRAFRDDDWVICEWDVGNDEQQKAPFRSGCFCRNLFLYPRLWTQV